jgi:hypothetical protein
MAAGISAVQSRAGGVTCPENRRCRENPTTRAGLLGSRLEPRAVLRCFGPAAVDLRDAALVARASGQPSAKVFDHHGEERWSQKK